MSQYIAVELKKLVREHFGSCCAYCQTAERLTVTTFEIEHIVPTSAGGQTVFGNVCLSCPMCNRFKSDRVEVFDTESQGRVPLFHPYQHRWSDDFVWSDDHTEIKGLTAIGLATVAALKMNRPQMQRVRRMWVAMGEHPPDFE